MRCVTTLRDPKDCRRQSCRQPPQPALMSARKYSIMYGGQSASPVDHQTARYGAFASCGRVHECNSNLVGFHTPNILGNMLLMSILG